MSTATLPARTVARMATRAAAVQAVNRCRYRTLVIRIADQISESGLLANDRSLSEVLAGEEERAILAAVGFGTDEITSHVMLLTGLRKAVALVQAGRSAEAQELLEQLNVSNAAAKVARLDKRLKASKAAVATWQAAIAHEQSCASEADRFGGRRARNPTDEGRMAIDRLVEADAAVHDANLAKIAAGRKFRDAVSAMTKFDFFGAVVDDDDDDEPESVSRGPDPIVDWESACGIVESTHN